MADPLPRLGARGVPRSRWSPSGSLPGSSTPRPHRVSSRSCCAKGRLQPPNNRGVRAPVASATWGAARSRTKVGQFRRRPPDTFGAVRERVKRRWGRGVASVAERFPRACALRRLLGKARVAQSLAPGRSAARAPARFGRDLGPARPAEQAQIVSRRLFERLTAADVREVEAAIAGDEECQACYANAPDSRDRAFLILAFGAWLKVPAALEKVKLGSEQPPAEVHAMARGPLAAAGAIYVADMVASALAKVGVSIAEAADALDFGCSSGRLARVLSAPTPRSAGTAVTRTDPRSNGRRRRTRRCIFSAAPTSPRSSSPTARWTSPARSRSGRTSRPQFGLRWFDEMRRLIRPGGYLVFTTNGLTSVDFEVENAARTLTQSEEIAGALYKRGWWYAAEFGERGDWGVINPDWGTAFLSPEWLLTHLCPQLARSGVRSGPQRGQPGRVPAPAQVSELAGRRQLGAPPHGRAAREGDAEPGRRAWHAGLPCPGGFGGGGGVLRRGVASWM